MKIFEALRRDHDKQRALIKLLLDARGDCAVRQEYYVQLKCQLESHAVAEERNLYAPLLHKDETVDLSRRGVDEHQQIDEIIVKLDNTHIRSPNWLTTFKQLADKVEHHLNEEEHVFFQQAGQVLNENEKVTLAACYNSQMGSV